MFLTSPCWCHRGTIQLPLIVTNTWSDCLLKALKKHQRKQWRNAGRASVFLVKVDFDVNRGTKIGSEVFPLMPEPSCWTPNWTIWPELHWSDPEVETLDHHVDRTGQYEPKHREQLKVFINQKLAGQQDKDLTGRSGQATGPRKSQRLWSWTSFWTRCGRFNKASNHHHYVVWGTVGTTGVR